MQYCIPLIKFLFSIVFFQEFLFSGFLVYRIPYLEFFSIPESNVVECTITAFGPNTAPYRDIYQKISRTNFEFLINQLQGLPEAQGFHNEFKASIFFIISWVSVILHDGNKSGITRLSLENCFSIRCR